MTSQPAADDLPERLESRDLRRVRYAGPSIVSNSFALGPLAWGRWLVVLPGHSRIGTGAVEQACATASETAGVIRRLDSPHRHHHLTDFRAAAKSRRFSSGPGLRRKAPRPARYLVGSRTKLRGNVSMLARNVLTSPRDPLSQFVRHSNCPA